MPTVWINSPLNGDTVAPTFNVDVGWDFRARRERTSALSSTTPTTPAAPANGPYIELTVTDGTNTQHGYSPQLVGDHGDITLQFSWNYSPGPVTLTADLYDPTPKVVATNSERITIAAQPGVSVSVNALAGRRTRTEAGTALVLTGLVGAGQVKPVEVVIYALEVTEKSHAAGKPVEVDKKKHEEAKHYPVGLAGDRWATVVPVQYKDTHQTYHTQYQCRITATDGQGGQSFASASVANAGIEVQLP